MAKDLNVVLLLDYYGELLPEKQRRLVEYYYCDDLSLAEISFDEDITRQGVRDAIKRAVNKLRAYENVLGFVKKATEIKDALNKFEASGSDKDFQGLKNSVNNL